jgi:glycine cleavage system aminomethyltransferase T
VTPADTPLEAGLSFSVSFKKNVDFIGRQSLEKQKAEGLSRRLIFLRLEEPEPTLLHDEPIWRNGDIIGRTSSGAFGYTVGSAVAMGYVRLPKEDWKQWLTNGTYEIEIAGTRFAAACAPTPFCDPQNTRVKA